MQKEGHLSLRVRYVECDPMGYLHHSAYVPYFEMGRVELLRQQGYSYRALEDQGILFVVTKLLVNYKRPVRYDDELELRTRIVRTTTIRLEHEYELYNTHTKQLVCTAQTTLACVGRDGEVREIPAHLRPAMDVA